MSNWDEHQRKMQGRMGLMRSMLSVSPYLTALCVGWATFQATHNIVLTIMAALILAAMGRVPIVPFIVLAIGQLVLIRWVTWPVYVLGGWGLLMMVCGYFIRKANLDFLDNYVDDGRFEHRPIDSDAEVVLEQQFEPEQPSEPDLWEDENDSPQEGESSVDARQELRISYTPSVPLKEKPERDWEKILLYGALSFVALLVAAVFMLMNLNQGNQQRQPYPSSYAPAQTAEYHQPASSPNIQTAQENKASSEQAEQFMNKLQHEIEAEHRRTQRAFMKAEEELTRVWRSLPTSSRQLLQFEQERWEQEVIRECGITQVSRDEMDRLRDETVAMKCGVGFVSNRIKELQAERRAALRRQQQTQYVPAIPDAPQEEDSDSE